MAQWPRCECLEHTPRGAAETDLIGQLGIADVIGYYICGTEEPHGSTGPFLVDAEVPNVFKAQIDEEADELDLPENDLIDGDHAIKWREFPARSQPLYVASITLCLRQDLRHAS